MSVRPHDIELFNGNFLDLADPGHEAITLEAVAAGLSKTCRFSGQCDGFYSVAEHAMIVAERLRELGNDTRTQLAGLHHDDHEAFLGDVTRPLKLLLPEYPVIARRVQHAIEAALDLYIDTEAQIVKDADNWALMQEAGELLKSEGDWYDAGSQWDGVRRVVNLDPEAAAYLWTQMHVNLVEQV